MNKLITLIKTKSVQWALVVAVLSVLQGFVMEFPLTPMHQMIAGVTISIIVVLLKFLEGV